MSQVLFKVITLYLHMPGIPKHKTYWKLTNQFQNSRALKSTWGTKILYASPRNLFHHTNVSLALITFPVPSCQLVNCDLGSNSKLLTFCWSIFGEIRNKHIHHPSYTWLELFWATIFNILGCISANRPYQSALSICFTCCQNIMCTVAKMTQDKVLKILQENPLNLAIKLQTYDTKEKMRLKTKANIQTVSLFTFQLCY